LASSVSGGVYNLREPGVLAASAQCPPENVGAVRDALLATIEGVAAAPATPDEGERVRRQLLAERERLMANRPPAAIERSEWAAKGDWRLFFLHRDRLESVTADDVNRAAGRYLNASNRTVGVFIPTADPVRAVVPAAPPAAELLGGYAG